MDKLHVAIDRFTLKGFVSEGFGGVFLSALLSGGRLKLQHSSFDEFQSSERLVSAVSVKATIFHIEQQK